MRKVIQEVSPAATPAINVAGIRSTDPGIVNARRMRGSLHIAVLITLTTAIIFAAWRSHQDQKLVLALELRQQLAELIDLKVNQVSAWRQERIGDATVTASATELMPGIQQLLASGDIPPVRKRVLQWMDTMRVNYQYANFILCGVDGRIRLSSGQLLGTPKLYADLSTKSIRAHGVIFQEVPAGGESFSPHFVLGAALKSADGATIGAVLFGIDPRVVLYPSILNWPAVSRTGKTVLVRREQGQILYLSDRWRGSGSAMKLQRDPGNRASPVVSAVLGQDQLVEAVDSTGVSVLAVSRQVPGSDWFVVAKIDKDEAYAPVRKSGILVSSIAGLLVLLSGACVGLMWRHQIWVSYRQQYEADQQRRALLGHYDYLTRYANDTILLLDQAGNIVEANDRATDTLGYSNRELLQMNVRDLKNPSTLPEFEQAWTLLFRQGNLVFQTTNQRRNGENFATEISARLLEVDGEKYCQSIVRDITERKQAELQIKRLNRLYAVLSHCGQAVVRAQTEFGLFDEVCRIAVELGGLPIAVIGLADAATGRMTHVAQAGESVAYLEGITITAYDEPRGRGPAGTCMRERRAIVINDLPNDPSMAPWKDVAARYGLRSSIALPLRRGGKEIGYLGLYSSDLNFFNSEEASLACEIGDSVSHALDALDQDRLRRLAESELRLNRERLELVLDASDEGYWDWNLVTAEAVQSPRYNSMLGYQPGELPAGYAAWRETVHPEDRKLIEARFRSFM